MNKNIVLSLSILAMYLASLSPTLASVPYLKDSSDGIHQITVFGSPAWDPNADTSKFDFVWSVGGSDQWAPGMVAKNQIILDGSYYDSIQGPFLGSPEYVTLHAAHPDWFLYECDKTTIATQYDYKATMLDISNPAVLDYMYNTGYMFNFGNFPHQAISWDNFGIENSGPSVCGIYDTSGHWVQKFTGGSSDGAWADAKIASAAYISNKLHALSNPVALITNGVPTGALLTDSVRMAAYAAAVDGILDEGGLLSRHALGFPNQYWLNYQRLVQLFQSAGKAAYSIVNNDNNNPIPAALTHDDIQFRAASYLLSKGAHAAVAIVPGDNAPSPILPELAAAPIGTPCGPMSQAAGSGENGVWMRTHSGGVSIVNSSVTNTFTVTLPAGTFKDLYGAPITSPVTMAPATGLVLLSTSGSMCSSSSPTSTPTSSSCQNLWNSTLAVPTGFGASFNLFSSAKELLINVLCSNSSETVSVGNSSQTEYIYNQGYYWSGTSWTPYTYSCSNLVSNSWCVGNAQTSLSLDPTTKQSVLAYICDWNGTSWNCGCHDSTCSTNYWNLQQFKQ
jgi:hypothetical protein